MEHTTGEPRTSRFLLTCWHADHGTQNLSPSRRWKRQVHILTLWLHLIFLRCREGLNIADRTTDSTAVWRARSAHERLAKSSTSVLCLPYCVTLLGLLVCYVLPLVFWGDNATPCLNPCKVLFCELSSNKGETERDIFNTKRKHPRCLVSFSAPNLTCKVFVPPFFFFSRDGISLAVFSKDEQVIV